MAGFFGLEWTNNATIEVIIEAKGFNNSLAGYDNCPNSNSYQNKGGINATNEWVRIYLKDATARFQSMLSDIEWTIEDTYAAQTMCPYETVCSPRNPRCNSTNDNRSPTDLAHSAICLPTKNGLTLNTPSIFTSPVHPRSNPPPAVPLVSDMYKKQLPALRITRSATPAHK